MKKRLRNIFKKREPLFDEGVDIFEFKEGYLGAVFWSGNSIVVSPVRVIERKPHNIASVWFEEYPSPFKINRRGFEFEFNGTAYKMFEEYKVVAWIDKDYSVKLSTHVDHKYIKDPVISKNRLLIVLSNQITNRILNKENLKLLRI